MNTRPLEALTNLRIVEDAGTEMTEIAEIQETDKLTLVGFTQDEIISLLWLRQWYQNGGSDRVEIVRQLECLKLRILNGDVSL